MINSTNSHWLIILWQLYNFCGKEHEIPLLKGVTRLTIGIGDVNSHLFPQIPLKKKRWKEGLFFDEARFPFCKSQKIHNISLSLSFQVCPSQKKKVIMREFVWNAKEEYYKVNSTKQCTLLKCRGKKQTKCNSEVVLNSP